MIICKQSLLSYFEDFDECLGNVNNCHGDADCVNNIGSYDCKCRFGYVGDGYDCKRKSVNVLLNYNIVLTKVEYRK